MPGSRARLPDAVARETARGVQGSRAPLPGAVAREMARGVPGSRGRWPRVVHQGGSVRRPQVGGERGLARWAETPQPDSRRSRACFPAFLSNVVLGPRAPNSLRQRRRRLPERGSPVIMSYAETSASGLGVGLTCQGFQGSTGSCGLVMEVLVPWKDEAGGRCRCASERGGV